MDHRIQLHDMIFQFFTPEPVYKFSQLFFSSLEFTLLNIEHKFHDPRWFRSLYYKMFFRQEKIILTYGIGLNVFCFHAFRAYIATLQHLIHIE